MNILFVTAHPAQIHHFNAVKKELDKRGHNVFWLATNKDISLYLLEYFGIKYDLLRRPSKNFCSKVETFFVNYHRTSLAIKNMTSISLSQEYIPLLYWLHSCIERSR